MNFTQAVERVLKEKYATFSGRAPRSEYWWFQAFIYLVLAILGLAFWLFGGGAWLAAASQADLNNEMVPALGMLPIVLLWITGFFYLAIIIPSIAVAVRRMHDRNLSGWLYLLLLVPIVGTLFGIYLFIVFCLPGTAGQNNYGPDPLA